MRLSRTTLTAAASVALTLALVVPAQARTPPRAALAKAQQAWWTAQGKPGRVRWSALEQRQLQRMSKIGPLSVDTFFKRVSVSKPDGKGGRWVYSLNKSHGDVNATRVHFGALQQPLLIYSERSFNAGLPGQVFKTWTFRQGDKKLPERFREAGQGLGPGRRDIVSIQHVFAGGKRIGTGISVAPAGRDMVQPSIIEGGFYRVPRRKTVAEKRISDLYRAHVSEPLARVQRSGYDSHQAWQRARKRVIDSGSQRVATTLKIKPAALQDALQAMLRR